ncbi:hypothetical protein ACPV5O_20835 [Vibrio maritimus]|uniref:hypothetical protein n=1 Tax=Vibrio maritimus TaxID=990268 RepID=UPI00406791FA
MKGMTAEQKTSYLNTNKPNLCPCCRSDEIEGSSISIEGKTAIQVCRCIHCSAEWQDTYTLSDITLFQ